MDPYHALVEATVQRARPVILTALAAVFAFIPLTFSVFWGSLAFTLIGGTIGGTVLTLVFLPALYSVWFRIRPRSEEHTSELQSLMRISYAVFCSQQTHSISPYYISKQHLINQTKH